MSIYEDLEARVRARGVRVEERLEILKLVRAPEGGERLAARVEELERAIEAAAGRVREVMR